MTAFWVLALLVGAGVIVWGADQFTEHLGSAALRLGLSSFALALLLAGAEPEELVTAVVAAVRGSPGIALGDVIGANVTICLVALGVGAIIASNAIFETGDALRHLWFSIGSYLHVVRLGRTR